MLQALGLRAKTSRKLVALGSTIGAAKWRARHVAGWRRRAARGPLCHGADGTSRMKHESWQQNFCSISRQRPTARALHFCQ